MQKQILVLVLGLLQKNKQNYIVCDGQERKKIAEARTLGMERNLMPEGSQIYGNIDPTMNQQSIPKLVSVRA